MIFKRFGEFRADALEMIIETNPMVMVKQVVIGRLNFMLDYLSEVKPDIVPDFVEALNKRFQGFVTGDPVGEREINVDQVLEKADNLKLYPELARNCLNYYLQVLDPPEDCDLEGSVEVVNRNSRLSHLYPRYQTILALIDLLGREEAIKFYKQHITNYLIEMKKGREDRYEDVDVMCESLMVEAEPGSESASWVWVQGIMADGKYAYKNENCLLVEALHEIEDKELVYLICCYGDYQSTKFHNQHFILTMEHTIAEGDAYCSRVIHDTRVDWDLRHPPKEFWEGEMNPP